MDELKLRKDLEEGSVQAGGEKFCRVGLFKVAKAKMPDFGKSLNSVQQSHHFSEYASQVVLFCSIQVDTHYIQAFDRVVISLWQFMVNVYEVGMLVEAYPGESYEVELLREDKAADYSVQVDWRRVSLSPSGDTLFAFNQADNCNYCYFLVAEEDSLKSEKSCCFKAEVSGDKVILCSKDRVFCEAELKRLVKTAFLGCVFPGFVFGSMLSQWPLSLFNFQQLPRCSR